MTIEDDNIWVIQEGAPQTERHKLNFHVIIHTRYTAKVYRAWRSKKWLLPLGQEGGLSSPEWKNVASAHFDITHREITRSNQLLVFQSHSQDIPNVEMDAENGQQSTAHRPSLASYLFL